ncbi:MAG TPA: hypothetical protein VKB50_16560 [Vicinamibacterales bacterium]|nr:hypothetical protein [Vicinamibacterales bacterium]
MKRPSMRLLAAIVLVIAAALCLESREYAQFETPSRQFHNQTAFPLDGRHRDAPCESCHRQGVYKGTPTRCFDCHWTRRQDDRYRLQIGSQCEQCHRPVSWSSTRFDHAMTGLALSAAHRPLSCQSCHTNNTFKAQTACVSCHLQNYQAARTPDHVAAGFTTTCEACHLPSDTTFHQARFFNHTSFALVGVHAQQRCEACHKNGVYAGTPTTCTGCHLASYNLTRNPNHAAAGFPTTCEACHRITDTAWTQGTFNHRFPITSGPHHTDCTNCHVGGVFQTFNCLNCHQRTETDGHHRAIAAYRYDSLACYSCHPNGRS